MTDSDTRALFGARLPFIQQLTLERQFASARLHDGLYHWLGHYQQMMVLEAGIAGVVIPLRYAQGPMLIAPSYLRAAVFWVGLSMMTGVVIIAVSKWTMVALMQSIQRQFAAQDAAMREAEDDEAAIVAALQQVAQSFQPQARRWMRLGWSGAIGDVVFYGSFLTGLARLVQGFLA